MPLGIDFFQMFLRRNSERREKKLFGRVDADFRAHLRRRFDLFPVLQRLGPIQGEWIGVSDDVEIFGWLHAEAQGPFDLP